MGLDELVERMSENCGKILENPKHFYYSSLAFLTAKGLDMALTSVCVSQYGIEGEQNYITRICMEHFGINTGLVVKNLPYIAFALGFAYVTNKRTKEVKNLGSLILYGITAYILYVVAHNYVNCF